MLEYRPEWAAIPWKYRSEHSCIRCGHVFEGLSRYDHDGVCPYCGNIASYRSSMVECKKKTIQYKKVTIFRGPINFFERLFGIQNASQITIYKKDYPNEK